MNESKDDDQPVPKTKKSDNAAIEDVVKNLSAAEREELMKWLKELLRIRALDASNLTKLKLIRVSFARSKSLVPVVRTLFFRMKSNVWDKRSENGKWFLGSSVVAIVIFGFQGAGIAALGGAIGLPLFIVFGSGVTLAKILVQEIAKHGEQK